MLSSALVLFSGMLLLAYTVLLLLIVWQAQRRGKPIDRGLPFDLLIFTPILILGVFLVVVTEQTFVLFLIIASLFAFGIYLGRKYHRQKNRWKSDRETNSPPQDEGKKGQQITKENHKSSIGTQSRRVALAGGLEIAYTIAGRGRKTLVFIHGLGSNRRCWAKNIAFLSKSYRCIALDLPGYGDSGGGSFSYDMQFFAGKVREFIHALQLSKVHLVGHSMGGQIAMTTLLEEPAIAQSLILLAPAGFETFSTTERTLLRNFSRASLLRALSDDQIRKNIEANFTHFPADAQFMVTERLLLKQSNTYKDYCRMIPKCMIGMIEQPVYNRLNEILTPTLILFGADDNLIPNKVLHPGMKTVDIAEAGARRFPNSHLEVFSPGGHFVQWECAEAVNRSIDHFLSSRTIVIS